MIGVSFRRVGWLNPKLPPFFFVRGRHTGINQQKEGDMNKHMIIAGVIGIALGLLAFISIRATTDGNWGLLTTQQSRSDSLFQYLKATTAISDTVKECILDPSLIAEICQGEMKPVIRGYMAKWENSRWGGKASSPHRSLMQAWALMADSPLIALDHLERGMRVALEIGEGHVDRLKAERKVLMQDALKK